MVHLVADFENIIVHVFMGWYHVIASRHDVTPILSITLQHLSYLVVWPYYDSYSNAIVIWVVGIEQIIDTIFASCRQHATMSRHDITMWRHAIFRNWSNTSMLSVSKCHITRYTKYCSNVSYKQAQMSEMKFLISWRDVMIMTSLYEVKSSCKWYCYDTSWLSNPNNHI